MEIKIYVGNLAQTTTAEDLRALFAQVGKVIAVDLARDQHSGVSNGFAFITMDSQREVLAALTTFNGYALAEHELRVSIARPHTERFTSRYSRS